MVAATLVAACGSSAKPDASSNTDPTTAGGSSNGGADFSSMLDDLAKQKFKVTWTDADGNEHTDAQDGEGNTASISGDTQVFQTPTSTVTCNQSDGTWKCTQTSLTVGSSSGYAAVSAAEKTYVTALADKFGNTSSKTIADRDADCFTITAGDFGAASAIAGAAGASLKGAATYCNDHETGAVLENTITDENGETTSGLMVTKFEVPSASDFQPPATPTVVTVPSITPPGGVGAQ
jgi:hypothetical protein